MDAKRDTLRAAEDAYLELTQSFADLDEPRMTEPWLGAWGVREILIHAAGWHREMIPALQRIGRGEPPYPAGVSYDDVDAWNARFVDAARARKLAQIVDELRVSHEDFLEAARQLPDERLAPGAPAREIFDGTATAHYREHAAQIRSWRGGAA
jgi:hypothetical protein